MLVDIERAYVCGAAYTIPASIQLTATKRGSCSHEGVYMRCKSSACCYRTDMSVTPDMGLLDTLSEINVEDKAVDVMTDADGTHLHDDAVDNDADMPEHPDDAVLTPDDPVPTPDEPDTMFLKDLWPHAGPRTYYDDIMRKLGLAERAAAAIILTPSAHPSAWLACRSLGVQPASMAVRF
jgi:hypothetical protein